VLVSGLEAAGGLTLPILGHLSSWQATFVIIGLPGLLVALWVLTLPEPKRVSLAGTDAGAALSNSQILGWLGANRRVYLLHFSGFAMVTLLFNAVLAWAPELFIRIHGLERADIGIKLGGMTAAVGAAGVIAGGWFSDFLAKRGDSSAPITSALVGCVCLTPCAIAAPLMPTASAALWLFAPLLFFASFPFGPAASSLQVITPPRMRAQVSAVYLFVVNLTGIGFGGTATALVTDYVFADPQRLHHAMGLISLLAGLASCLLLYAVLKPFRRLQTGLLEAAQ